MTEPWLEVHLIECGVRHYLVGHDEQQGKKLSKVRNSTAKVGCVSQLVKGELHKLKTDQNSQ